VDGGEYSNTTTAGLSINTTGNVGAGFYRCEISGDNAPTVLSNVAEVVVNAIPPKPVVTSSVTPVGGVVSVCTTSQVTLSAPAGSSGYAWSDGSTTEQITVSIAGSYTVSISTTGGCTSVVSDAITVVFDDTLCGSNTAPVIEAATASTTIGGFVTIDLADLITDADNNLVLSSLTIVQQPASGATAEIVNGILRLDYSGINFTGTDRLTIEVCDMAGECAQRELEIEVIGDIMIYNAVSPNGDGKNDVFLIEYVDLMPDTQKNTVTIFNRWGDVVFETSDYNNTDRVFKGLNKSGNELPSGAYYYRIKFQTGRKTVNGYLSLKR
jgi:gliding motility-associated-like protein